MRGTVRILIIFFAYLNATGHLRAQTVTSSSDTVKKKQERPIPIIKPKGPKPITKEISGGFRLNSNGWSVYTDMGKVKTQDLRHSDMFYDVRLLQIEISEKKSPHEEKTATGRPPSNGGTDKYIYGKINNFYAVKLGWGFRKMLAGKPDPGTVSIHWVNVFGVSIGLLKPYYINVSDDPSTIKYTGGNQSDFLNQDVIEGKASLTKGLNEIKINPGGHIKSALHFDFSANRKNVLGIETGVNVEYYSQGVPLMAEQPATPYFVDIFLAFQYGRRW
jgi:hypothetical protein